MKRKIKNEMNIETLIDSMPGMIEQKGLLYILQISKSDDDSYSIVYKGTAGNDRNPILCQIIAGTLRECVIEMIKQIRKHVVINDW